LIYQQDGVYKSIDPWMDKTTATGITQNGGPEFQRYPPQKADVRIILMLCVEDVWGDI
jgi:hypothetical protein